MHWNEVKDFKSIIEAFIIHALLTDDDGGYCHTFKEISNIAIVKKTPHIPSHILQRMKLSITHKYCTYQCTQSMNQLNELTNL